MKVQRILVAAFIAFVGPTVAHAGVIVVDAAGGGAFTQIQSAVDAALEHDTILVKPGSYSGFAITAKSLTVVGDRGPLPNIIGLVTVTNLEAGKVLTLARLKGVASSAPTESSSALLVQDCIGAVRIVACDLVGPPPSGFPPFFYSNLASSVRNSPDVAFAGCILRGADGVSHSACETAEGTPGAPGLWVFGSSAAVYDCAIRGGDSGDGGVYVGATGGPGVRINHITGSAPAFVFTSRSTIRGGDGGSSDCSQIDCPSNGGDGFQSFPTTSPPSIGWVLDCVVSGGPVGVGVNGGVHGGCEPVGPGLQYENFNPLTFTVSGLALTIPTIAREGGFVIVTFTGAPGAQVFLNDELTTTFQPAESWRGVLLSPFPSSIIGPARSRRWGVIPPSGVLTANYRVPMLPPGADAQTRFLQAYQVGPNGLTLGGFRTLTVLDSAF